MGVYEDPPYLSASEQRWEDIWDIVDKRHPFPSGPFSPRNRWTYVRRTGFPWVGNFAQLSPVAFIVHATVHVSDDDGWESGDMVPYLFVHERRVWSGATRTNLVRAVNDEGITRYEYVIDSGSITDEDLERLKIGVQGSPELLEAEFLATVKEAYASLEKDTHS